MPERLTSDHEQAQAARGLLMINLVSAMHWFDEALEAGLTARGWSSVTRVQTLVLASLATGVNRATKLARNLGVTRQAMSQTLAEMEERGLVTVSPDPDDKRARLVDFSPQSADIRDDAMMILKVVEATLASRIGQRRLDDLKDAVAADWGASPVEIIAVAAGAPLPPRKPRGRPRKVDAAS